MTIFPQHFNICRCVVVYVCAPFVLNIIIYSVHKFEIEFEFNVKSKNFIQYIFFSRLKNSFPVSIQLHKTKTFITDMCTSVANTTKKKTKIFSTFQLLNQKISKTVQKCQ